MQVILSAVDKPRKVSFKGTTDLVTETDKSAEEAIIKVTCQPLCLSSPTPASLPKQLQGNAALTLQVIRESFPHHGLLGKPFDKPNIVS